jgi:DNA-binding MarR family transcriptional regulator
MTNSAFFFENPKESPGLLLWQVTTIWQRSIRKALEPHEITHPQFTLMAILLWLEENNQAPTQAALTHISKLDKMTISQVLKLLSFKGYVKRREHPLDTRAKLVSLTVEGKRLATQLVSIVESIDRALFFSIDESEQKQLTELLNKIKTTSGETV